VVFIVEDDTFFLNLLTEHFKSNPSLAIKPFSNGADFLKNLNEKPDLIILDYILDTKNPGALNGKEVYFSIKEKYSDAKVIFLSGQESADVVFELIKLGVRDYVMKDDDFVKELDDLVNDYLKLP
ncbi:MAG: response regulator, partial [Cytophagales bacterium]|nr:response regulator [Cytophagales bacterium]